MGRFSAEFWDVLDLKPMLLKLLCKIEKGRKFPNSFCEASVSLKPRIGKGAAEETKLSCTTISGFMTLLKLFISFWFNYCGSFIFSNSFIFFTFSRLVEYSVYLWFSEFPHIFVMFPFSSLILLFLSSNAWSTLFQPFNLMWCLFLKVRCVSWRQQHDRFCFLSFFSLFFSLSSHTLYHHWKDLVFFISFFLFFFTYVYSVLSACT